ncbi:DMT family transporter [Gottschalkiaceae bacterium SANA]|nr:DMT family transporter [Gottschalkiaceae bacterium SANA]
MTERVKAQIALIISVVIWGVTFINMKIVLSELPPITSNVVRFAMGSAILWILLKFMEPKARFQRHWFKSMFWTGFFGVTIYYAFEGLGIDRMDASSSALIMGAIPLMTLLIERKRQKQPILLKEWGLFSLSTLGIYFTVMSEWRFQQSMETLWGIVFLFIASIGCVMYAVLTARVDDRMTSLQVLTYQTTIGSLLLLPGLLLEDFNLLTWFVHDPQMPMTMGHLLFLVIGSTVIAYYLYVYSVRIIGAADSALYMNIIPLVTLVLGTTLLGERLSVEKVIGAVCIILAVFLSEWLNKRQASRVGRVNR